MNKTSLFRQAVGSLFFLFLLSVFLAGCVVQKRSCPPITTTAEAAAILKEYSNGLQAFKATGNSNMNYTDKEGKKISQTFPVRIWFVNSSKFCLYGDVAFDPKGMSFALDGDDFWVYAKLFEVYVTGKISEAEGDYLAGPAIFLDFLQPVGADCDSLYMADAEKDYNILICGDSKRCRTKKIFIDRCSRFVEKIEYLNCSGNPIVVVELDDYKNVAGEKGFSFPRRLTYEYFRGQKPVDSRQIKLNSVKLWQPNPAQLKALFTPPDAGKFQKEAK